MTATTSKSIESRVRRKAARLGMRLRKSPVRDTRALEFGRFLVVDAIQNRVVFGADNGGRYSAELGEVEVFLSAHGMGPSRSGLKQGMQS